MPDFTAEAWASFKAQFMSVIQFVLYCFDLCFDAFRSNPLLYIAFFFPIFALAFFVIFDLLLGIAPFNGLLFRSREGVGSSSLRISGGSVKNGNIRSLNLASSSGKGQAATSKTAAGDKSSASVRSANLAGGSSGLGSTSGFSLKDPDQGRSHGIDLNNRKFRTLRKKFKEWNNPIIYKDDENDSSVNIMGPKPFDNNTTLKQWLPAPSSSGNSNANLDIDAD